MAYIANSGIEDYYNTNYAVGPSSPNKRDDVMLVQWLLRRVYADHPLFKAPDNKGIKIDGWIGPQTNKWIKAFQLDVNRLGFVCSKDGRVDSARKYTGAVSKTIYTILWLNGALSEANPEVFSNPASDPDMPTELLSALASGDGSKGPYVAEIPRPMGGSGKKEPGDVPAVGGA